MFKLYLKAVDWIAGTYICINILTITIIMMMSLASLHVGWVSDIWEITYRITMLALMSIAVSGGIILFTRWIREQPFASR